MMFCPKCGAQTKDGAVYCPNCGAAMGSTGSSGSSASGAAGYDTRTVVVTPPARSAAGSSASVGSSAPRPSYSASSSARPVGNPTAQSAGGVPQSSNPGYSYNNYPVQAPVQTPVQRPVTAETLPPQYRPLGAWAYFGYNLLFAIPIVGFILLIVFSVSDTNINRRNYARSFWCALLVSVIITVLLLILATVMGLSLSEMLDS